MGVSSEGCWDSPDDWIVDRKGVEAAGIHRVTGSQETPFLGSSNFRWPAGAPNPNFREGLQGSTDQEMGPFQGTNL